MSRRDPAASIRQRLLDRARSDERPFQEVLQYYAMERFLYRLAQSPHRDRFILKGALLLTAWRSPHSRPTKDIDLEGRTRNDPEGIKAIIREICASKPIEGIRARFQANMAKARIAMQVDVGFGDVIVPDPVQLEYPTILDLPAPVMRAYPRETVVAEKLEAMTVLGTLNSRLKDYFDLWLLSRLYPFDGEPLATAILATFQNRGTEVEADPIGLGESFASDPAPVRQWSALRRRSRLDVAPADLTDLVLAVREFAEPVLAALATRRRFIRAWPAGGPWTDK